jgi:naphthoate synthase
VGACPTVGATQYIPRLIGDRLAKEMIFLCRTFPAEEAVKIGLINKVVPKADLRRETEEWCQQMKGYSGQTLRATKKSLNFESDELYASWQQGMELLAEIWGSDESLEGMNAFLEKRKPDFHKFRLDRKTKVDQYLNDLDNDLNQDQSKF